MEHCNSADCPCNDNKTIKVRIKNVYGNKMVYPLNYIPQLQALTKTKTLSENQIEALVGMGFVFEVEAPSLFSN
jgi:hypothetical protein